MEKAQKEENEKSKKPNKEEELSALSLKRQITCLFIFFVKGMHIH
ncbi:hypothetical protein [Bacillus cereus]|nr:hypothetical protein [Bacillus cereus]